MATKVDICNLALSHIGSQGHIQSLTESSVEAKQCNLVFDTVLDELLRQHPWSFATRVGPLATHASAPPPGWLFRYEYPPDCLNAFELLLPTSTRLDPAIPYAVELLEDGSTKSILADAEGASLRYVMRVTDTALFDAQFTEALSWRLARELAMPLTRKAAVWQIAEQGFRLAVGSAWASDLNERHRGGPATPASIQARA